MPQTLDRFILDIPYLFLKKIPYAWIAVIALWSWPPIIAGIFFAIILIGLLMMKWQTLAWKSALRREHASANGKFYIDQPSVSWVIQIRNLAILLIISGALGWLLKGQFGLSGWQFFFLIAGFTILYKDTLLFGAPTIYVITDQGIGIRFIPGHVDYRLFFDFQEINRVGKAINQARIDWDIIAPLKSAKDGLLLIPKNPNGFSKEIRTVFIAPKDVESFLQQLPSSVRSIF